tara:strand:- start:35 stop:457 length:423 start_codon:yes stop_codon:yes gene_type:complete
MRIYLSTQKPPDIGYQWIPNIASLNQQVLDGEATSIIVDRFLCGFAIDELEVLLNKIISKLRLNADLTIMETDIDFLCTKYRRSTIDIEELNSILFQNNNIKSLLTIEHIAKYLPPQIQITHQNFDAKLSQISMKCRRTE